MECRKQKVSACSTVNSWQVLTSLSAFRDHRNTHTHAGYMSSSSQSHGLHIQSGIANSCIVALCEPQPSYMNSGKSSNSDSASQLKVMLSFTVHTQKIPCSPQKMTLLSIFITLKKQGGLFKRTFYFEGNTYITLQRTDFILIN